MRVLNIGAVANQIAIAAALFRWFPLVGYIVCFGMLLNLITIMCKRLGVNIGPFNRIDPFSGVGSGLANYVDNSLTRLGIILAAWSMPLLTYAAYASSDVVWLTALLAVIVTIMAVVVRL